MKNVSLAIDGGHSMFKVRAAVANNPQSRISFNIPTAVIPAISLSNEQTRLRAEVETVELDGRKYFFGETALRQGRAETFTGQNSNWIEHTHHDVLILGALKLVLAELGFTPNRIHLVLGLPSKYFVAQKDVLRRRVQALLSNRLFPGQAFRILVQSQADAPLQWLSISENGKLNQNRNLNNESWGVIEIGHFTTDFALSERGSILEFAVASCPGMHLAYETLSGALASARLPTSLDVIENALRTRQIKLYGKPTDVGPLVDSAVAGFKAVVLDEINRIFADRAPLLDGVIVGGGGAEILFDDIRNLFPNAISSDDPRMMVAEGFCRLGLMSLEDI